MMHKIFILMNLTSVSIILSCKEEVKLIENWKGNEMVTVLQEPCLKFVSPALIDNSVFGDQGMADLALSENATMLGAYIQNVCADTVLIGLTSDYVTHRLNVGYVGEYWDKNYLNGGAVTIYCFNPIDYYCPITPSDSVFVLIEQIRDEVACMMDSVIVHFHHKVGIKKVTPIQLEIDGGLLRNRKESSFPY